MYKQIDKADQNQNSLLVKHQNDITSPGSPSNKATGTIFNGFGMALTGFKLAWQVSNQ